MLMALSMIALCTALHSCAIQEVWLGGEASQHTHLHQGPLKSAQQVRPCSQGATLTWRMQASSANVLVLLAVKISILLGVSKTDS
jgi:hypothetical protein